MDSDNINASPWLHELQKDREITQLQSNLIADVAIIGGGISGLATAFFTLQYTDKSVALIEAGYIGHGATGHNAGQVVDYFEKPFYEIVNEYGLNLAVQGQRSIYSAWDLLSEIIATGKIDIPFSKFVGFAGCTNLEQLLAHFENKLLKMQGGLEVFKVGVADDFAQLDQIPDKYRPLYGLVPRAKIHELLETTDTDYIAVLQSHKGTLNSALFVQELAAYLKATYPDRFQLFEKTPVATIELFRDHARMRIVGQDVLCIAERVVLCTNGFENITIVNTSGSQVDKTYHDMVYGIVGYMAGYVQDKDKEPIAISYLPHKEDTTANAGPYFYLTRRNHTHNGKPMSLVCIGGPEEIKTADEYEYKESTEYPDQVKSDIQQFLDNNYRYTPDDLQDFHFKWHGLMGYTQSGIRCVGVEPINEVLLYNLGCNGIGILPSLYGAKKISRHIGGEQVEASIFDPQVQRSRAEASAT